MCMPPFGDHRDSAMAVSVAGPLQGGFDFKKIDRARATEGLGSAIWDAGTSHHKGALTGFQLSNRGRLVTRVRRAGCLRMRIS